MKIKAIVFLMIFTAVIFGGKFIANFSGSDEGDSIVLSWNVLDESNVKEFVINRKNSGIPFTEIETIKPNGNHSYTYEDKNIYKVASDLAFIYQIKAMDHQGKMLEDNIITVTKKLSDYKRTWGSIKAMFR